jgi:hypothetical protein
MTYKTLLRSSGASALIGAIALVALPSAAQAQERHGRWEGARSQQSENAAAPEARQQAREQRATQRAQAAPQQRQYQAPQAAPAQQQQVSRGDWNRSATGAERQGRDWNRRDNSRNDWGQARAAQARAQAQVEARTQGEAIERSQEWQRNRSYTDGQRNQAYTAQTYRNGYNDGRQTDWRRDHQQTHNAYRSGYRDGNRYSSGNYQRWSNDWRRDSRYNWSGYRNANRSVFHLGTYYAPYRNYRYSRIGIGFTLDSLFFGSNYWINDPWQYRLPEAYGPYRWVRYYDDALLVDVYTGEVVDVIYDFFW